MNRRPPAQGCELEHAGLQPQVQRSPPATPSQKCNIVFLRLHQHVGLINYARYRDVRCWLPVTASTRPIFDQVSTAIMADEDDHAAPAMLL
jgi:hypothetical protein